MPGLVQARPQPVVRNPWLPKVEWIFISEQLRRGSALVGQIESPLIDIEGFAPSAAPDLLGRRLTVRRVNLDFPE